MWFCFIRYLILFLIYFLRVQPNAHSYGEFHDLNDSNLDLEFNNRNIRNHNNKQRIPKHNKSIQTTVRLVNNKKFNTIHNINTNFDDIFKEETSHSNNFKKRPDNSRDSINDREKLNRYYQGKHDLDSIDNRIDKKLWSQSIPEEQVVNVIEDEWTFKDLDLWLIK